MKCFTVTESAQPGIEIVHPEGLPQPCLLIGETNKSFSPFPVSSEIAEAFLRRAAFIEGVVGLLAAKSTPESHKALLDYLRAGDSRTTEDNYLRLADAWANEYQDVNKLFRADVSTNEPIRITRERNPRSDMALVSIETQTAEGGDLWFEANSYRELEERQGRRERVVRAYDEFPSAGVRVLATGNGVNGELRALCVMKPGASFRIVRTGVRQASPVLIVAWPGSKLRVFSPKKYQNVA